MLARYKIYRGKLPANAALPAGIRQDTRKHTRHCLRPPADAVTDYLIDPTAAAWKSFALHYRRCLQQRWETDRTPFEELASLAATERVFLGCSCPTKKNPNVQRCHTVLALKFMKERFPTLDVQFP